MSKPITKKISSDSKKKWLTLGLVGTALLLIPRRSSRQDTSYSTSSHSDDSVSASLASDKLASEDVENCHTNFTNP